MSNSLFTKRLEAKPYEHPHFLQYDDAMVKSYWTIDEFKNLSGDVHDYYKVMTPTEQTIIKRSVLAISQIEVGVKDWWGHIGDRMPKSEVKMVGYSFAHSEGRHFRAYSHFLDILGFNSEFTALLENPVIQGRVDYMTKYFKNTNNCSEEKFILTVALFAMYIENVSLFWQFATIKSFNKYRGMLKGLDNIVEATQKEETIHALFGAELVRTVREQHPDWFGPEFYATLSRAAKKAYDAESRIIDWVFETGELDFLQKETIQEFTKERFNESLTLLGGTPIFDVDKAEVDKLMWFKEEIKTGTAVDFFHTKSTAYTKFNKPFSAQDLY